MKIVLEDSFREFVALLFVVVVVVVVVVAFAVVVVVVERVNCTFVH